MLFDLSCVMCGENITQKVIAMAAGVTEVTIRNRYKGLKESLKIIETTDFLQYDLLDAEVDTKMSTS